jgi:hypothetical protein
VIKRLPMKEFLIICMGFPGCISGVWEWNILSGSALFDSKHVRRRRKIIDTQIRCLNTNK